jgi:hypothetical protein
MAKIYLAMLFVTMTAFILNGTVTDFSGTDFDDSVENVLSYTQESEALFIQGFTTIFGTAETLVTNIRNITEFWVNLTTQVLEPLVDYDILDLPDPTVVCRPYDELPLTQIINYTSALWWYNLWNEPNIENTEDYHNYLQVQRYGEAYNSVCS